MSGAANDGNNDERIMIFDDPDPVRRSGKRTYRDSGFMVGVGRISMNPRWNWPLNAQGKLDVGGALDLAMSVIKDMGLKEPYVGQIALADRRAEDLTHYFCNIWNSIPVRSRLGFFSGQRLYRCARRGFYHPADAVYQ